MSRHLSAVPDPEPSRRPRGDTSPPLTGELLAAAWGAEWWRPRPAGDDGREFRRRADVVIGEPATEAPGWWVCPSCGRRVDRAGERRTVTGRVCTGPDDARRHRRHAPTEMSVQR